METFKKNSKGEFGIRKDPEAVLDYTFDWTDYLVAIGDTISSYEITVTGGVVIDSHSRQDGIITVWASGGTVGTPVKLKCRIVTAGNRTDEFSVNLYIKN